MALFSRKLGVWTRCAAVVGALLALVPATASADAKAKPAAHAHRPAGKRAAVATSKGERAHADRAQPKTSAKGAKDTPKAAAKDAKDAGKDAPKAAAKGAKATDAKDAKDAKAKDAKPEKDAPTVPASSVGSPNEGKLVGGVKLGTADGTVRVVPAYKRGDTRWGLPALVKMLERSAKKVAKKYPGAVLGVGDISKKNGGDIFLHRSHESGRDADVAFYVNDHKGKSFLPDTFVRFEGSIESNSHQGVRFDVAKNWALVQAWLEDPGARVSHIFVADPLRRMLLAYAKPRVSPALYNRAALAMMQPSNALPHDDHFHVRISCPATMRKSCVEYPVGVKFAKKGNTKAKPGIVTPKGKQATTATQALAVNKRKAGVKPAPKPAQAKAQADAPRPRAKAMGAAPGAQPPASEVADFDTKRKKPIYLQSAAANDADDPLDRVLFSVPALSHLTGDDDSDKDDADHRDAKPAVDDSGAVKITD